MKNYYLFGSLLMTAMITLSCTSARGTSAAIKLPLQNGWYQYDFERTFKGIEVEYDFYTTTGMKMIQEITWKYTGTVCRVDEGVLYDPVMGIELIIDDDGLISCAENFSIRGILEKNGRFFWSGLVEEHGTLNSVFVTGTLRHLPVSARGGREFDGIYHMTDMGTGRKQLVNIRDGFFTWNYIDGIEAEFTPWPTLVRPNGFFASSFEVTTVMKMGEFANANYSTFSSMEGRIVPGEGISMVEMVRTSGIGHDQGSARQIYSGTEVHAEEYPNEMIPSDIESLVKSGKAILRTEPRPDAVQYPSWYLKLPAKKGFIYAAGEKTFNDTAIAYALAEAAAAAEIAERLWVQVESTTMVITNDRGTRIEERIKAETAQQLNYRVIERVYNNETKTAFVLVEMAIDR